MTEPAGYRIFVDGAPVTHHSTRGVQVSLVYATGEVAEVQVAKIGADLVVVIDGMLATKVNERGHTVVVVSPRAKVPA